jgi:hypothetical protein
MGDDGVIGMGVMLRQSKVLITPGTTVVVKARQDVEKQVQSRKMKQ